MCAITENSNQLRIAGVVSESIADGPGLRMTLFTQGCPHHCPGCHNPETHALTDGYFQSIQEIFTLYKSNPLLSGMTFSGGEPFLQALPLARLAEYVHNQGGDIVTYTGYYLDELIERSNKDKGIKNLLKNTDILIDGPFILKQRNLELQFRGSENQHIIYNHEYCDRLN